MGISALVAAVSAEAQYTYAGFPYAGVPFGSSTGLDPITQGLDPVTQGAIYGKREAEADADAQIVSPYTAGYTGYPFTAGYAGYPYAAGYAGYPYTAGYAGYPYT